MHKHLGYGHVVNRGWYSSSSVARRSQRGNGLTDLFLCIHRALRWSLHLLVCLLRRRAFFYQSVSFFTHSSAASSKWASNQRCMCRVKANGFTRATFLTDYVHTVIILVIIFIFAFTTYATSPILGSPAAVYELLKKAAEAHPVEGNAGGSYLTMNSRFVIPSNVHWKPRLLTIQQGGSHILRHQHRWQFWHSTFFIKLSSMTSSNWR